MSDLTVWRRAYNVIEQHGWTCGTPVDGKGSMCAGGAIAHAVTGNPMDLYDRPYHPDLQPRLEQFAEHVGAPKSAFWSYEGDFDLEDDYDLPPNERLYEWNDVVLEREQGKSVVLKALLELDALESAKC